MVNKKSFIIILLVGIAILTIYFIFSKRSTPPAQNTTAPSFQSIEAGINTPKDVVAKLGEPLSSSTESLLEYKSKNPNLNNSFTIENNKVVFIREIIGETEAKTSTDIIAQYGGPEYVLFGPNSVNGFNLYVYPKIGLAYIGHVTDPALLQIWYFEPMSLDQFISKWASDYSLEHKPIQ
jgi:hypothetical protein